MKKRTLIIIISLLIISCISLYIYLKANNKTIEASMVKLDDSTVLIENIDPNYIFELANEEIKFLDDNEKVSYTLEKTNNGYELIPPNGGYLPYHFYTITLGNENQFLKADLKDFKKICFYVRSEDETEVLYQDDVVVDSEGKYDGEILLTNKQCEVGQIIIAGENRDCKALQITDRVGNNKYRYRESDNIEEVYQSILINEHIENDFRYVETADDIILAYVKDNDIFSKIFDNVNAITLKDIDIKISKNGNKDPIGIEITIKHENIVIGFIIEFSYTIDCKSKGISYISEKRNLGISLKLNISSENSHSLKDKITSGLNEYELEEMYIESIKNQPAEMNKVLDLCGIYIPIFGPFNLYTDLSWKNEMSVHPNLDDKSVFKLNIEIGYGVKNGKLIYQYVTPKYDLDLDLAFAGKIESKCGPTIECGIDFMNSIKAGVEGQVGAYVDSYGTFRIDKKDIFLGHFETGGFCDISFIVSSPITKSELVNMQLGEKKIALKTISNIVELKSHNLKDKYTYKNNGISLGNLKAVFNNKLTKSEEIYKLKDYTVYIDGKQHSSQNGKINLSKDYIGSKHNIKITFKHNGRNESLNKDVDIVKGSNTYVIYNELLSKGRYNNDTIDKNCQFLIANLNNKGDEELVVVNNLGFQSSVRIYTNDFGNLEQLYNNTLFSINLSVLNEKTFSIFNHIASDTNEIKICSFKDERTIFEESYQYLSRAADQTDWPWYNEDNILLPEYEKCRDGNDITVYYDYNGTIISKKEFDNKYNYSKRLILELLDNNVNNRNNIFDLDD